MATTLKDEFINPVTSSAPDEPKVAELQSRLSDLRQRSASVEAEMNGPRFATSDDPAVARLDGRALKRFHASTDRDLRRFTRLQEAKQSLEFDIARTEHQLAEARRVRLTRTDVQGARFVRTSGGWRKVVRCSAKSVTVETGYSWTDRIPLDKILEVRS